MNNQQYRMGDQESYPGRFGRDGFGEHQMLDNVSNSTYAMNNNETYQFNSTQGMMQTNNANLNSIDTMSESTAGGNYM